MKSHLKETVGACSKSKFRNRNLLLFGLASLVWVIFRTGTKPSRIVYPCQRAALANSSMLLGISIPILLASVLVKTKKFLFEKGSALMLLIILAGVILTGGQFWGSIQLVGAVNPNQELQLLLEPRNAILSPASDIFVLNGRAYAHIIELINLMGSHGLRFYKSATFGVTQGPDGLIARDDVVLIKINEEWPYRGGTNTDVLKELIQAIVSHPEGFVGEIVVADNGQWQGSMDWSQSNAQDITQSTQDVVDMFSSSYKVSTYSWIPIRSTRVSEYSAGDMTDGYVLYDNVDPETGIYVSYPKFETQFGTYISFKNGIWNGEEYEERLKIINLPVLKSHGSYGVTASLKHYMGVQSQGEDQAGLANGHSTVATGGMGTLMVETGLPTLNIIDAIWINANPPPSSMSGPNTPYDRATRVNVLMASTDPVALDYWAAKHVLVQAAHLIGYSDTHTLDPDSTDRSGVSEEAFGVWLGLTKNEITAGGYDVTSDENQMNIYVKSEYVSPTYTLTITSTPGGSTTPVGGSYTIDRGQTQQVTAIPSTGYRFSKWLLNGVDAGSSNQITVTMNQDYSLQAVFAKVHMLTITTTSGGSTSPASGVHMKDEGQTVQVVATPSSGYIFANWILDGANAGSANPISVLMNADHNLNAVFDAQTTPIDDETSPEIGMLSQNPTSDKVNADKEVQVSVNVTDADSGVKNVTLLYTLNNGTFWESRIMNYDGSTNLYEATIPGQETGTWVQFKIVAYDNAGNNATNNGTEAYFMYQVITTSYSLPLTTLFAILLILVGTTLLVIVYMKHYARKRNEITLQKTST
jgi:hypothetical protein